MIPRVHILIPLHPRIRRLVGMLIMGNTYFGWGLMVCFWGITPLYAQIPTAPVEGLQDNSPRIHALTNARIIVAPGTVIPRGTLVFEDGVIRAVGAEVAIPSRARVWDLTGKTVYPGFIESYSQINLPKSLQTKAGVSDPSEDEGPASAKPEPTTGAQYWNPRITAQKNVSDALVIDEKATTKLRALGFTEALVTPGRGIMRGTSSLINLSGKPVNASLIRPQVAQNIAFEQSGFREGTYPSSLMGSIALIRQTLLDAQWYSQAQAIYSKNPQGLERPESNSALAALESTIQGKTPVLFETTDELDLLRVVRLAEEFKLRPWLKGNGYEYRVIGELAKKDLPIILPLNFPEVPEIETPGKALDVDLEKLQHWDLAPSNPARLAQAGIDFALTTDGLKKPDLFWGQLRKAVKRGLTPDQALAALTTTPAGLLGVSGRYGTLDPGKVANLVVTNGDLFTSPADVLTVWVDGQFYDTDKASSADPRGSWQITWSGVNGATDLEIKEGGKATLGGTEVPMNLTGERLILLPPASSLGQSKGIVRLAALVSPETLQGTGETTTGTVFTWTAKRTKVGSVTPTATIPADQPLEFPSTYPAGAFGRSGLPAQPERILVKNTTLWTSGPQGKLLNSDLLITKGKITQLGKNINAPGAVIIDGTGKHVTAGLIDAHSHTAISRGVNEGTQAVTAEVRIGDVIDATDIGIYRELAGGLTTANLLHGSANPIGGQNQVIKLRWGALPEGLKFKEALPGIKFALGENVKQSNWGERFTTRYPQTRMGVEQLLKDEFLAASEYGKTWANYKSGALAIPPRRDLQRETLLEILNKDRMVHVHSYRQDEILMFVRLAGAYGFPVTFQHILEGYKVADAMAAVNAGGSSFSDWWGYKFEVYDAIPTNGALMSRAGVLTSFNSDSNDLARRMNTEAAKAVKYGGVSEEEALKFVTLNPAQQMFIDRWVGSLEPGKDADFVIWNGHPLSTLTKAEQTWIDGRKYFDLIEDQKLREVSATQREALIQKALPERQKALTSGGAPKTTDPKTKPTAEELYHALEFESIYHSGQDHHNCSSVGHNHDL